MSEYPRFALSLTLIIGALGSASVPALAGPGRAPGSGAATPRQSAEAVLQRALTAMGGEARLRALRGVRVRSIGYEHALEQSERPEGPWIAQYEEHWETIDLAAGRLRRTRTSWTPQSPEPGSTDLIVAGNAGAIVRGERVVPAFAALMIDAQERIGLGPERLLLAAADSEPELLGDAALQGIVHHRVAFSWRDGRAVIWLHSATALPTAVDLTRAYPDDVMLGVWGDLTTRRLYSYWNLEPGGLRYPRQVDTLRNGQQLSSRAILDLELDPAINDDDFEIPEQVAAMAAQMNADTRRTVSPGALGAPAELAPGVVQVPGWWNVVEIQQEDGVVLIEGPLSSEYMAKIFADVEVRFPGARVSAVINTTDAWPHIGGLREVVAAGVPVITQELNRPLLDRLFAAPFNQAPDRLARTPATPSLDLIDQRTEIGTGANRLVVAPIGGEWSERMLMVYLPEHRLLYGSDLVFPPRDPAGEYFMPIYLEELATAVAREGFEPETVIAMHAGPTPWRDVLAAIAAARR